MVGLFSRPKSQRPWNCAPPDLLLWQTPEEEQVEEEVYVEIPIPEDAPEATGEPDEIDPHVEWCPPPEGMYTEDEEKAQYEVYEECGNAEEVVEGGDGEGEVDGGGEADDGVPDGGYLEVSAARAVVIESASVDAFEFPDDEIWQESLPNTWEDQEVPARRARFARH